MRDQDLELQADELLAGIPGIFTEEQLRDSDRYRMQRPLSLDSLKDSGYEPSACDIYFAEEEPDDDEAAEEALFDKYMLSGRERQIARLMLAGQKQAEIARMLGVSRQAVGKIVAGIREKMSG